MPVLVYECSCGYSLATYLGGCVPAWLAAKLFLLTDPFFNRLHVLISPFYEYRHRFDSLIPRLLGDITTAKLL
jgi:hypothetical protein